MSIMLTCEASATIAPERATEICETFRKELQLAYPDHEIIQNINLLQGAELTLRITAATKSLLSIQLDWTAPSGETAKGQIESVSAMDRNLTPSMTSELYRMALAHRPMP